jgi:hypothetical protein
MAEPKQGLLRNLKNKFEAHAGSSSGQNVPLTGSGQGHQNARPGGPLKSKRGLCWPNENKQDQVHPFTRPGSKVTWLYNWSPNQTPDSASLEFVPMQWNNVHIEELHEKIRKANVRTVIAFNEPVRPIVIH